MAEPSTTAADSIHGLPPEHPAQAYVGRSAGILVGAVQSAAGHPLDPATQVVFTAFYHRYGPFLTRVIARHLGRTYDRSGLQEVVHDTFLAFFSQCDRFDPSRAADDDACERNLRCYLAALARWKANEAREFQASIGAAAAEEKILEFHAAHLPRTPRYGAEATADTQLQQRVENWIASLSDRDADVLRAYFLDDHAGRKSDRLPSGTAATLAAKYGVTPSNLRHLKSKLIRELRAFLAQPASVP